MRHFIILFIINAFLAGCPTHRTEKLSLHGEKAKRVYAKLLSQPSREFKKYVEMHDRKLGNRLRSDFKEDAAIKNVVEQILDQKLLNQLPFISERAPNDPLVPMESIDQHAQEIVLNSAFLFNGNEDAYNACLSTIGIDSQFEFEKTMDSVLGCWYDNSDRAEKLVSVELLLRHLLFLKQISRR